MKTFKQFWKGEKSKFHNGTFVWWEDRDDMYQVISTNSAGAWNIVKIKNTRNGDIANVDEDVIRSAR